MAEEQPVVVVWLLQMVCCVVTTGKEMWPSGLLNVRVFVSAVRGQVAWVCVCALAAREMLPCVWRAVVAVEAYVC